jgi:hypothetical protein
MKIKMRWIPVVWSLASLAVVGCAGASGSGEETSRTDEVVVTQAQLENMQKTAAQLDATVTALNELERANALREPLLSLWTEARGAGYRTVWIEALPPRADGAIRVSGATLRQVQEQVNTFDPVLAELERPTRELPASLQRAQGGLRASVSAAGALEEPGSETPMQAQALREKRCCVVKLGSSTVFCDTMTGTKVGVGIACAHEVSFVGGSHFVLRGGGCGQYTDCP